MINGEELKSASLKRVHYDAVPSATNSLSISISSSSNSNSSSSSSGSSNDNDNDDDDNTTHHSHKKEPLGVTRATYIYALCASVNSCNLGYDVGVNTQAGPLLKDAMDLTVGQLEFFLGSLNLFAMVGALSAHVISDRYGRRASFITAAVCFIVGVLIVVMAQSFTTLMMGRVFVGLGVGFGLAIDSLYISEISPAANRGRLVTWCEIGTNVGVLLGFGSGYFFRGIDENLEWRYMIALGTVLPLVMIVLATYVMPESPRWLVAKGRTDEARNVLQKTHPAAFNVGPVLREMQDTLDKEQGSGNAMGWSMILCPTPAFRRMLLVGLGAAIAQQAVGIDAIQYFMLFIIEESGVKSGATQTTLLVGLGIVKLVFAWVGGQLFDQKGRRNLLFLSLSGMMVSLMILAINFARSDPTPAWAILGLALYLATFSIGMGPGCWLVPSEVFATCIRAKAMSMATFLNRVFATLMASSVLPIADAITWTGFFLMLCTACFLSLVFFFFLLPETKGRSLEDMSLYFAEITGDRSILDAKEKRRSNMPTG